MSTIHSTEKTAVVRLSSGAYLLSRRRGRSVITGRFVTQPKDEPDDDA